MEARSCNAASGRGSASSNATTDGRSPDTDDAWSTTDDAWSTTDDAWSTTDDTWSIAATVSRRSTTICGWRMGRRDGATCGRTRHAAADGGSARRIDGWNAWNGDATTTSTSDGTWASYAEDGAPDAHAST